MAKAKGGGRGGKAQTSSVATASSSASSQNGPTTKRVTDKENSIDLQNTNSAKGQRNTRGERNHREKQAKIINNDDQKAEFAVEDGLVAPSASNHVSEKKESSGLHHSKVLQPTTEQLMIAKIIDHSDDPHQRKKIQQVMDVTGKPEDEVATALFDAGWDESRAVELLLEDGDHLSAWEETGKKKKGKKANEADKEDWDNEHDGFQDPRQGYDKSRSSRGGPPRRGRGGSNAKGQYHNQSENGGFNDHHQSRDGQGFRGRGNGPPRRGGRGGGTRTFAPRGNGQSQSEDREGRGGVNDRRQAQQSLSSSNAGGFQGSIDTWNNPNENNGNANSGSSTGNDNNGQGSRSQGSDGQQGGQGRRGGGRSGRGGGQSGKDAFDNAGNWGDDFPNADEWDNEEYTGSLADTKVFTASGGQPHPGQKQRTPQPQQQQQGQQQVNQQPHQGQGGNSQRGFNLTSNGPNSYSQSIDLSTLLQKPTTQSSVGSNSSAAPGAQFNQQATETLKAVVGIGSTTVTTKDNMYPSYAQASAFTSIKAAGNQGQKPASAAASQAVGAARPTGSSGSQPRIPQAQPAVEMPGDSLGRLDVQFGGLDLQFGNSSGANTANSDNIGGFEFGASDDKTSVSKAIKVDQHQSSFAPSAKEVNKSLSNAVLTSSHVSGSKLNPSAPVNSSSNDSFSNKANSGQIAASTAINSVPTVPVAPGSSQASQGSSNNYSKGQGQDLSYPGYNNYNKSYNTNYQQYQYPNNQFSSQQGSAQGQGNSSQFKGQYDKYEPQQQQAQQMNNPAAAVLGLANTSTTNALSGKVSATTASKVNMPNLPPGVASALMHPQYMGLAPAAYFGLQQPAMYGAYGNTGLEDLAAIQRATASATGMHTLPTTGYYDPNNQFAASNLGANVNSNRGGGVSGESNSSNSLISASTSSTSNTSALSSSTSGFGSASGSITSTDASATATSSSSTSGQHQVQQQQQQPQQPQQQTAFNPLATNAFAAQQMPPGYAYYFGNMGNIGMQPYGAATTPAGHVYPPAMTVPGATATSQFQKSYGTSYGSGYETLGQQGNKDFSSNYSSNGQSKSNAAGGSTGAGKGAHQYWGNTLTSTQLW